MNMTPPTTRSRFRWLPWTGMIVGIAAAAGTYFLFVVPTQEQRDALANDKNALETELTETKHAMGKQTEQIERLLRDKDSLSEEKTQAKGQLERALKEKQEALAALAKAKKELSDALGTQIAAGDVLIKERNGELVLDVADRLLFDTGKAEITEGGQAFLLEVAKSMKRLGPAQVFRVGGHTDNQRVVSKEVAELYPTNWELSTARATNVVRFLQDRGRVPGRQLVAAGFAEYRPVATNQTEAGRQQNRRIEIVLVKKPRRR